MIPNSERRSLIKNLLVGLITLLIKTVDLKTLYLIISVIYKNDSVAIDGHTKPNNTNKSLLSENASVNTTRIKLFFKLVDRSINEYKPFV